MRRICRKSWIKSSRSKLSKLITKRLKITLLIMKRQPLIISALLTMPSNLLSPLPNKLSYSQVMKKNLKIPSPEPLSTHLWVLWASNSHRSRKQAFQSSAINLIYFHCTRNLKKKRRQGRSWSRSWKKSRKYHQKSHLIWALRISLSRNDNI